MNTIFMVSLKGKQNSVKKQGCSKEGEDHGGWQAMTCSTTPVADGEEALKHFVASMNGIS